MAGYTKPLVVLSIVLAVLLVAQTALVMGLAVSFTRTLEALPDTVQDVLDAQIDAGHEDPVLAPDDPLLAARKVLLFHDVNARTAKDVCTRLLYLDALDRKAPIDLYVSTQGGWSDSAFTIIDTMRMLSAPVNVWAVGACHSAGALILTSATGRRYATEDAILMIHTNLDDSQDEHSYDRLEQERYEHAYRETTRLPDAWYPMTDDQTHYLSPEQALAFRLVDEVVPVWKKP